MAENKRCPETCDIAIFLNRHATSGPPVKGPMTGADYYGVVRAGVAAPHWGRDVRARLVGMPLFGTRPRPPEARPARHVSV